MAGSTGSDPGPGEDIVGNLLEWEELNSFFTPADNFFWVRHYGFPTVVSPNSYRLTIDGLVDRPQSLTLADLERRARRAGRLHARMLGNTGLPFFIGAVGNARWAGTPLAPLLRRARIQDTATEVVFWGADEGTVTIRDNTGITARRQARRATVEDRLDLTITEQFARSMKLEDAMNSDNLICFEMNGKPLPPDHGYPVRLIAPGWYGVANVKWLTRIEVIDHRFAGRFMARDYVSIREDESDHWTFQHRQPLPLEVSAGQGRAQRRPLHDLRRRLGRTHRRGRGEDRRRSVEAAELVGPRHKRRSHGFAWRFWTLPWPSPSRGEHEITSRAIDVDGNVQPAPTTRSSRAGGRTGRPTARSPAGSRSPDASRLCVTTYVVDRVFGDTSLEASTTKRLTTPCRRRRLCSTEWLNKEGDGGRRAVPGVLGPGRSHPA